MRYRTLGQGHKKARGGKRHLKRLLQQRLTAAPLYRQKLWQYGYDHAQLGLGVWHWHHRQPPQQVRQLAAQHLLTTFFDWHQQLQARPEPFYLAVWLVAPHFAHNSQVVAGIRERAAYYQNMFGEPDPGDPPLPPEYQQLPGANQLIWRTHRWEVWLDIFDYPETWPTWALRKPHAAHTAEDGQNYLMVQTGWVWVGQASEELAM